ncbi:MAG TPA: pyridoxal phosphate-dependent aminotransferase family protein [Firmicutes bacterium]|nr:pyridoxal phosphate-dependent aminotransferase family protein [Bacillota bacterium]
MTDHDFYSQFKMDMTQAQELGFNPYYIEICSGLDDPIIINGKEYINLASNNYLGLATDSRVKQAMHDSIDRFGASMCGTPIASGYVELYRTLCEKLSQFSGLEDTIIFPSGYQANYSLFPVILGKDDLVIVDHYAHASLIQGIKSIGCKIKPFKHNDLDHLTQVLQRSKDYKKIIVVTESVFSTEGSIAPLDGIVEICSRYGAVPVVDDSHGIGVLGKTGRGILEEKKLKNFPGIYTASLGKALAGSGGMIAGKKGFIEFLKYSCSGLIYSTALPPAALAGLLKVLEIMKSDHEEILKRMWDYKHRISDALEESGFILSNGKAPITSVIGGSLENTVKIAKALFNNGILSTPFVPPSVPPNGGKVRLIAGANLKEETVSRIIKIIKNELKKECLD